MSPTGAASVASRLGRLRSRRWQSRFAICPPPKRFWRRSFSSQAWLSRFGTSVGLTAASASRASFASPMGAGSCKKRAGERSKRNSRRPAESAHGRFGCASKGGRYNQHCSSRGISARTNTGASWSACAWRPSHLGTNTQMCCDRPLRRRRLRRAENFRTPCESIGAVAGRDARMQRVHGCVGAALTGSYAGFTIGLAPDRVAGQ